MPPVRTLLNSATRLTGALAPLGCLVILLLAGCAQQDTTHKIVISIPEQRMLVLEAGHPVAQYPVSTSRFCESDRPGSCGTPLGELEIARKIGGTAPAGAVFKNQHQTGEILLPDTPGRDPIVSRILWLRGLEACNRNAYGRYIYIHGTAEERRIGTPASFGCIRMRSADVIQLYNLVGVGAKVDITMGTIGQATGIAEPAEGTAAAVAEGMAVPRAVAVAQ
jgi:hypothetical protein